MSEIPEYDYGQAEQKMAAVPLRDVLAQAVTRLNKELEILTAALSPVIRKSEPAVTAIPPDRHRDHSSELAEHVYEIQEIANRMSRLSARVEI